VKILKLKQIVKEELLKKHKMKIIGKTIDIDSNDVDDFAKMLDKYKIKYIFPIR